jgi:hypothetical protein
VCRRGSGRRLGALGGLDRAVHARTVTAARTQQRAQKDTQASRDRWDVRSPAYPSVTWRLGRSPMLAADGSTIRR